MTTTLAEPIEYRRQAGLEVKLLSGFEVRSPAGLIDIPHVGSRLVAYLALQYRPISRVSLAGVLWPETTQEKAQASLRSALWRVRKACEGLINAHSDRLSLCPNVSVDVGSLLVACEATGGSCGAPGCSSADVPGNVPFSWFSCELLPDWYDDWVVFERERFRLTVLHALDQLAASHRQHGDYGLALGHALAAIRLEPLRESSHRELIATHLAQGNLSEAISQYGSYRTMLHAELGIEPSPLMDELLKAGGLRPNSN